MPVQFTTELKKFANQGEKTGWTYILIPKKIALVIKPGNRQSFRVKGSVDGYKVKGLGMIPMGNGDFIIPVNATMRKVLRKQKGASVDLLLEEDLVEYKINPELIACLADEPEASLWFKSLLPSHQRYYSKWIEAAKTDVTKIKRIAMTVKAMLQRIDFGEMLRNSRDERVFKG